MLRVAIAQCNFTVGDFAGNVRLHQDAIASAAAMAADMVVFSELSVSGYYPKDLIDDQAFRAGNAEALGAIRAYTLEFPSLTVVLGTIRPRSGFGKLTTNSLLVIKNGTVIGHYDKQLLPTYGIFDERRHFEPGTGYLMLAVGDQMLGFVICEDVWNMSGAGNYEIDPVAQLVEAGVDLIVSINASPSDLGKRELRHRLFAGAKTGTAALYVNQIGGQDDLVFDGRSFATDQRGVCVFEAAGFAEDLCLLTFDGKTFTDQHGAAFLLPQNNGIDRMDFYRRQIVLGLKDYARRCGFKKVVVGCSGGIDSALTLALAVEALGPANVVAITMPSVFSSEGSVSDSVTLCSSLGIELLTHPIAGMVKVHAEQFQASTGSALTGLALENLQARVRAAVLMEFSNSFGHLLLTTGNKSETAVGFFTIAGDAVGGLNLIGDLYKTEVWELSRSLNQFHGREVIPLAIIDKIPSAELAPGQRDEDRLPPYPVLDQILKVLIEGLRPEDPDSVLANQAVTEMTSSDEGRAIYDDIRGLIAKSEYKRRQAAPILRVRSRAFGSGRQIPITAYLS